MEKRAGNIFKSLSLDTIRCFVVTGLPRGGTTLLGSLISSLENAYCLSEPLAVEKELRLSVTPEEFMGRTRAFFAEQRKSILCTGKAVNRIGTDGRPVTNYFRRIGNKAVVNSYVETESSVTVRDDNFILAVKHNAHFISILPLLCDAQDISVIGIIRHPIPTIMSWRSLDLPISSGRLPSGEKFWPELREIACSDRDMLVKQVMIYELITARLLAYRERIHLLCYESLVCNPSQLTSLLHQQYKHPVNLQSRNRSLEYNWEEVREVQAALMAHAPTAVRLYSIADFESTANWY